MTIADGIYFNMGEDDYHALPRLSASGIKNLRISPATFWADSWLNPAPKVLTPEQEQRKALAKLLGKAYHCARLEPGEFLDRYIRQLDKADFVGLKGFVAGGTAYGEALGELGQTKKKAGESVAEQAARLRAAGYEGPIWDLELAEWEAGRGGRTPVPALNWDEIELDMERIAGVPEIQALLSDGFAEVSILWTCPDTQLPMKCRLDYLTDRHWADFKTYANPNGKHVQQAITDTFKFSRYHVQAAVQREAIQALLSGLPVHGAPGMDQLAMLDELRLRPDLPPCFYIWQEKGGIPNLWARQLRFHDVPVDATVHHAGASEEGKAAVEAGRRTETMWFRKAQHEVKAAKRDFLTYSQVYPAGDPWLPFNPVGELSDADFSQFWLEGEN